MTALMLIGLACGAGEAPAPKETGSPPESTQAQDRPGPSGSPGESTSPVIPGGAPLVSLTHEGTVYYQHRLSTDEAANLKEDDLELVGSTNESNTRYPGATGAGLMIYRLKDGETNDVYTFRPGEDHVNPEDGQIFKGQDVWIRWTTP